ncbi:PilX N-terminal domain-containing pilus assembly protein [Paraliobacillus sp. JSM ZJ581]|uniref:pilus assembly PilX N-terminal domain-containing protein n=1 Tax=Paraliobacillus sp. JSM ZJ581 TaxID=3342118 RepID=UPI0035A84D7B
MFFSKLRLKEENGSILATVLMTLTVLSLLGIALATASFANVNLSSVDRAYQSTFYIAEGGANQTYASIESIVNDVYDSTSNQAEFYTTFNNKLDELDNKVLTNFSSIFKDNPSANISIQELNTSNPRNYQIISEGVIGERTRTVTRPFQINWTSGNVLNIPDRAVAIVKNNIHLSGSSTLNGNVYVESSDSNTINMSGGTSITDGAAYVPESAVNHALNDAGGTPPIVKPNTNILPWIEYQRIVDSFPIFPSYTLATSEKFEKVDVNGNLNITQNHTLNLLENISFNSISITGDSTLKINTNNQNVDIVVDNLNVPGGHIEIIGTGTIDFYVKNIFSMGYGEINGGGAVNQVNVYLAGNNSVNLSSSTKIIGSLFAKTANVTLKGGGGFKGFIVTGGNNVTFDGGSFSNLLLLAPNANIKVGAGAMITGTLIGNSLTGSGGTGVTYKDMSGEFPFGSADSPSDDDLITKEPSVEID